MTHTAGQTIDDVHLATLGRLTRGALHEIANPLLALVGTAELALAEAEPGSKLRDRLETVQSTGLEIAAIVRALQGFLRQRHDGPRRLSLADAAREAVDLVRLVAAAPDVEIRLRTEAEPRVHEPPAAVSGALVELLLDALAATGRSGTIDVVVRAGATDAVAVVDGEEIRFPRVEA